MSDRSTSRRARAPSILLVDDEPGVRDSLSLFLQRSGWEVEEADSAPSAIEVLARRTFTAVLTDISMPGEMSGLDLLRHVSEHHLDTDVLIMTGHLDVDYAIQALKYGAFDYFKKPFVYDEVLVTLRRATERRQLLEKSRELDRLKSRQQASSEIHTQTMVTLAGMLDAKNPYTRQHSERVSGYAHYLGREIGLDSRDLHVVTLGGKLHDIGKIGTPESVLNKNGKLTPEEWALVKQHPICGWELLKPLVFMKPYLPVVRWHHERLDGKGYPDGLTGDQIPSCALVVKVADMYDAITSNRPYRDPMTFQQAIDLLESEIGTGLPEDLVRPFIRVLETAPWRSDETTAPAV